MPDNTMNLSPYVRVALNHTMGAGTSVHRRVIFDYELLLVKGGEALITVDGVKYQAVPGKMFLFKPRQTHEIIVSHEAPFHQLHVHFDLFEAADSPNVKISFKPLESMNAEELSCFREDVSGQYPFPIPCCIKLQNPILMEKLLFDIIEEYNKKLPYYSVSMKGLLIRLWSQYLREAYLLQNRVNFSKMADVLEKAKSYLDSNLDRQVSLDELSEIVHYNKYYLSHQFKEIFGDTPIHYHTLARISKAKELIQYTRSPLTEIAEQLGFESIHNFSRIYKKYELVPPSAERINQ